MQDLNISVTTVLATTSWLVGVALTLAGLFTPIDTGDVGLLFAVGAATLNVRGFVCQLACREQNAFDLGRDFECDRVRSLR